MKFYRDNHLAHLGFQEIYTHKNPPPMDIETPKKKPFIILNMSCKSSERGVYS